MKVFNRDVNAAQQTLLPIAPSKADKAFLSSGSPAADASSVNTDEPGSFDRILASDRSADAASDSNASGSVRKSSAPDRPGSGARSGASSSALSSARSVAAGRALGRVQARSARAQQGADAELSAQSNAQADAFSSKVSDSSVGAATAVAFDSTDGNQFDRELGSDALPLPPDPRLSQTPGELALEAAAIAAAQVLAADPAPQPAPVDSSALTDVTAASGGQGGQPEINNGAVPAFLDQLALRTLQASFRPQILTPAASSSATQPNADSSSGGGNDITPPVIQSDLSAFQGLSNGKLGTLGGESIIQILSPKAESGEPLHGVISSVLPLATPVLSLSATAAQAAAIAELGKARMVPAAQPIQLSDANVSTGIFGQSDNRDSSSPVPGLESTGVFAQFPSISSQATGESYVGSIQNSPQQEASPQVQTTASESALAATTSLANTPAVAVPSAAIPVVSGDIVQIDVSPLGNADGSDASGSTSPLVSKADLSSAKRIIPQQSQAVSVLAQDNAQASDVAASGVSQALVTGVKEEKIAPPQGEAKSGSALRPVVSAGKPSQQVTVVSETSATVKNSGSTATGDQNSGGTGKESQKDSQPSLSQTQAPKSVVSKNKELAAPLARAAGPSGTLGANKDAVSKDLLAAAVSTEEEIAPVKPQDAILSSFADKGALAQVVASPQTEVRASAPLESKPVVMPAVTVKGNEVWKVVADALQRARSENPSHLSVEVRMEDGSMLGLEVRMSNSGLHASFRSESQVLLKNLEAQWAGFVSKESPEAKVTAAVFEGRSSFGNSTETGSNGGERRRQMEDASASASLSRGSLARGSRQNSADAPKQITPLIRTRDGRVSVYA